MEDPLTKYGLLVLFGMVLGVIFFGGLWVTVRKLSTSKRPALLFLSSAVVRTLIVLSGIWYFAADDATSVGACLLGFIGLRLLATHGRTGLGTLGRREFADDRH